MHNVKLKMSGMHAVLVSIADDSTIMCNPSLHNSGSGVTHDFTIYHLAMVTCCSHDISYCVSLYPDFYTMQITHVCQGRLDDNCTA